MPFAPPKACACGGKVAHGVCSRCGPKQRDIRSYSAQQYRRLYKTNRWKEASKRYRGEYYLCVTCRRRGLTVPSEVVDHIIDHKGNEDLFWDESNWQALCRRCNSIKANQR